MADDYTTEILGGIMANWTCRALTTERVALERARDARMGRLGDERLCAAFNDASRVLTVREAAHRTATGCTDMH